jgi:hypothetical protein
MTNADLPEATATHQQNLYTVLQLCAVFVFRHANLCMTGIHEVARSIYVLPPVAKP